MVKALRELVGEIDPFEQLLHAKIRKVQKGTDFLTILLRFRDLGL